MRYECISFRYVTSKSQNIVFEENIINDFIKFINILTNMCDIPKKNIVYID